MSRIDRVNSQIRKELSEIIQQEMDNPNLGLISIIRVDTSRDLGISKVFFSVLPEDKIEEVYEALYSMKGFMKKLLGDRLKIKFIPDLKFIPDDSIKRGIDISKKIDEADKGYEESESEVDDEFEEGS